MAIQITEINPRLILITEEMPNLQSAAIGFFTGSGSRYENIKEQGITHFLEHMFFKGTKTKSAHDISRIVESCGATIDGFTSREISGIYFHCLAKNLNSLIDLFFELNSNLNFDEQELKKERNVILQEITESYEDPQEYAYQLFTEIMFQNHPLSYPIAGTPETLKSLSPNDLIRWYQNTAQNCMVYISAAGNINHQQILDNLAHRKFQYIAKGNVVLPARAPQNVERRIIFQSRPDLKQVHTIAGFLTIPLKDKRRYALTVLNNIIGGTESSRASQILREQVGLLSSVFSFLDLFSDIGLWCVYHISDIKNRERSLMTAFAEVGKLKKDGIIKEEFIRSVNYCKGMLALDAEEPSSRMNRNTRNVLLVGHPVSVEESIAAYDNLTFDYVNSLVEMFELERYSAAITGPITVQDLGKIGIAPMKIVEKSNSNL
jgi:predicted Zn-dependent peptidase